MKTTKRYVGDNRKITWAATIASLMILSSGCSSGPSIAKDQSDVVSVDATVSDAKLGNTSETTISETEVSPSIELYHYDDDEYLTIKAESEYLNIETRNLISAYMDNETMVVDGIIVDEFVEAIPILSALAVTSLGLSRLDADIWAKKKVDFWIANKLVNDRYSELDALLDYEIYEVDDANSIGGDWVETVANGIQKVYGVSEEGARILSRVHLSRTLDWNDNDHIVYY